MSSINLAEVSEIGLDLGKQTFAKLISVEDREYIPGAFSDAVSLLSFRSRDPRADFLDFGFVPLNFSLKEGQKLRRLIAGKETVLGEVKLVYPGLPIGYIEIKGGFRGRIWPELSKEYHLFEESGELPFLWKKVSYYLDDHLLYEQNLKRSLLKERTAFVPNRFKDTYRFRPFPNFFQKLANENDLALRIGLKNGMAMRFSFAKLQKTLAELVPQDHEQKKRPLIVCSRKTASCQ